MATPFEIASDLGTRFDLRCVCPQTVRVLLESGVERHLWRQYAVRRDHPEAEQGLALRQMRSLVKATSPGWEAPQRGALKAAAVGGLWDPARVALVSLERSHSALCQRCGQLGTQRQRIWC